MTPLHSPLPFLYYGSLFIFVNSLCKPLFLVIPTRILLISVFYCFLFIVLLTSGGWVSGASPCCLCLFRCPFFLAFCVSAVSSWAFFAFMFEVVRYSLYFSVFLIVLEAVFAFLLDDKCCFHS